MSTARDVLAIFATQGSSNYFGERVTVTQHSLQAAFFAQQEQAPEHLVVAALLHDIGHLLEAVPADLADWKEDARHEEIGARWLAMRFGPEISEPVRLHVPAKRYLCATEARYYAQLSAASVHTLKLQGGPMSAREVTQFQAQRYGEDAVRVRRCDDQGKVAGLQTPALADYAELIDRLTTRKR